MADISAYTQQIATASRGEVVRDAITSSIKTMVRDGINAKTLAQYPVDHFALAKDVNDAFIKGKYDDKPIFEDKVVKGSMKTVKSGGLYDLLLDLNDQFNDLLGE